MIPSSGDYTLANARIPTCLAPAAGLTADGDGLALVDLSVSGQRMGSVRAAAGAPGVDLGGRMILPAFVDCHTHLDKGHVWARKPNPDGSFMGALNAVMEDRTARWTAADVRARMEFGLRCAYAHGTKAIRTHLDSIAPQDGISWPVFEEMRDAWKGRIALQAACLVGIDQFRDQAFLASLADRVASAGGILGAVTFMVPDIEPLLDAMFRAAMERGLDLDFHADETDDTQAVSLRLIAEAALRHRHTGRILVGHCCALARQPDAEVLDTLDKVARAGISIVSLPMCNLYLQDRRADATTPRWRGITLMHELKARGIPVSVASDNTRDPFYAYGDLDMLEVYRMATRIAHFDHPVGDWPLAVTATPAAAMGLDGFGALDTGSAADFVVFRGRRWTELLSRPESDRIVVRDGRAIAAAVPDYAELDGLME